PHGHRRHLRPPRAPGRRDRPGPRAGDDAVAPGGGAAMSVVAPSPARAAAGPLAVSVKRVDKRFGDTTVLDGIDLQLRRGEFVAVLGASGSGKTTLLRLLAGLDTPTAGDVWVPQVRTVVFQEHRLVPSKRVWQNVVVGMRRGAETKAAALAALAEVGLADKA